MRGLVSRITVVLVVTVLLIGTVVVAIGVAAWRSAVLGVAVPEPARISAIAMLVEDAPPAELPTVLKALNSEEMAVWVTKVAPSSDGTRAMPWLTSALNAYRRALDGRPVKVMLNGRGLPRLSDVRWTGRRLRAPRPIRLVVGLHDGRTLVLETHSPFTEQFTGLRLSLLGLLISVVIAGISLVILRRQVRPIERLAAAVQRFGTTMEVASLPEEGAGEVRQLTAAFNRLQSQIKSLVAARTRMIAAISHDLGTYLTRLRLRAEFISEPDQRERAVRDLDDMHALMRDTLAMARLDHAGETETVDLVELARASADRLGRDAITITAPSPVAAAVQPAVFSRVFDNLIANALKYGGQADVTLHTADGGAEILVEDRGPGIPAEEREAVLEPFYRRDTARNLDERGFGLGLAIVAEIVRHHGGSIALEDRSGGGLCVRVSLPPVPHPVP